MFDIVIIGAGVVGLATAIELKKNQPNAKIAILEKEAHEGLHQTSHNSGVIHSGIYYKPQSLKAINCQRGYRKLIQFCDEENIPYEICGKIIVATTEGERASLNTIYERGIANGLNGLKKMSLSELKEVEPYVSGIEGVWVPQAGIVDYKKVAATYLSVLRRQGVEIYFNSPVLQIRNNKDEVIIQTSHKEFSSNKVISACGLHSDRIARMTEKDLSCRIIPFRGEYYTLKDDKKYLVKNLIYPVPNPQLPFLGVHFTRMISGGIEAGPNAVLAFAREGYSKKDFNFFDLWETLTWPGFYKVSKKYWKVGCYEMYRAFSKHAFAKSLQSLIPEVQSQDLVSGGSGVRAQACDQMGLVDDFAIYRSERVVHLLNAPSPAATSSLSIGEHIAQLINKEV